MRAISSSKECLVLKTLRMVRIKVPHDIVGVTIALVAFAGAIVLPAPNIYFHWGGSLHENRVRFQLCGLSNLPNEIIVGRAPCVTEGLRFRIVKIFPVLSPPKGGG